MRIEDKISGTNVAASSQSSYLEPRWYAAHTRSRHEKSVSEQLHHRRVETFLPSYEMVRHWKNGDHRITLPLFPGYTFVRIALKDRLQVLKTPGLVRLVGFNGIPVPLADHELDTLQNALLQGMRAEPHPYLSVGRRVRITAGPLTGREGLLVRKRNSRRVVLSIDLIQRSILVQIDAEVLEPIHGK